MRTSIAFRIRSLFESRRNRIVRDKKGFRSRLFAEFLEDRAVPAVITWDGGAGSMNFFDKANWGGDQVPGPNDDAVIPSQFGDSFVLIAGPVTLRSIRSEAKVIQIESAPGLRDSQLTVTAGASVLRKGIDLTNWYGSGYQYVTYKSTANSNSVGGTLRITATGNGTTLSLGREFDTIAPYFFGKSESDFPTDISPQLVTAKNEAKITANDGARIDIALNQDSTMRFHEISYVSNGQESRIDGNGLKYFRLDPQSEFYVTAHAGGVVSFPALQTITRETNVVGMKLAMTSDGTHGGTISMPELKSIDKNMSDHDATRQIVTIEISGNGTFEAPKLETLKSAVVKLSGTSPGQEPLIRRMAFTNLVHTDFEYDVKGGQFQLDVGGQLMSGSISVKAGKFDLNGKVARSAWDVNLESRGPTAELNVSLGYIPEKLGNFVRVSAIDGGRLTLDGEYLQDLNADRPSGGVYLKAESGGVLQVNASWISGVILDVTPNSTVKLPNLVDGDFEQIRGYNGNAGRIEAPKLQIMMLKKFEDLYLLQSRIELGGMSSGSVVMVSGVRLVRSSPV